MSHLRRMNSGMSHKCTRSALSGHIAGPWDCGAGFSTSHSAPTASAAVMAAAVKAMSALCLARYAPQSASTSARPYGSAGERMGGSMATLRDEQGGSAMTTSYLRSVMSNRTLVARLNVWSVQNYIQKRASGGVEPPYHLQVAFPKRPFKKESEDQVGGGRIMS